MLKLITAHSFVLQDGFDVAIAEFEEVKYFGLSRSKFTRPIFKNKHNCYWKFMDNGLDLGGPTSEQINNMKDANFLTQRMRKNDPVQ